MAHLYPDTRSLLQILASRVIEVGESPKHVAIIMDGNRRFAKSHGLQTKFGHQAGLEKAKEVCRWGYEMETQEITLYAFSIENFKRSMEQVDELMSLTHDYCIEMVNELKTAKAQDCCVQFIGNWNLFPAKSKPNMARIMLETRHCKTFKINVAIAYTGRNGMLRSIANIEQGIKDGQIEPEDVSEYLIDEAQNLMPMAPVDMLIRTGGDSRISDFMMWESSNAYVHFLDSAWPEVTFWELWDAAIKYQMFRRNVTKLPPSRDELSAKQKQRVDIFLQNMREKHWNTLKKFAKKSDNVEVSVVRHCEDTPFRTMVKKLLFFN